MISKLRFVCVFFAGAFLLLAGVLLIGAARGSMTVLFPGVPGVSAPRSRSALRPPAILFDRFAVARAATREAPRPCRRAGAYDTSRTR